MALSDDHTSLLRKSAVSDEVAALRGYWTATRKAELARLGFAASQQLVPALVIPIWNVRGEKATYQIRPDEPRAGKKEGKLLKYETMFGARMVLDVPPGAREFLGDPAQPLWITEGSRKADAAVSAGLCCVSLLGVWGWRGTNAQNGKTVLADFEHIAMNGREVVVAFDSDAMVKPEVGLALDRFGSWLQSRDARVRYVYFPAPDGAKVGLDDFLAGNSPAELQALVTSVKHPRTRSYPSNGSATLQPQLHPPRLATAPDLTQRVAETVARGVAGEQKLVRLIYLAVSSRLLPNHPVSVAVKGPSAGGKSYTVERVLALFPPEAFYLLTAMSEHSLAYGEEPLQHRVLVLFEMAGLNSDFASLLLRTLLSEGCIRYETTEKTEEGLKVRLIEREGPTSLITTTTLINLHPENETRLFSLTVDDTKEQTQAVLGMLANRAEGDGPSEADLEEWHRLQEWLQSLAPQDAVVPFARRLAAMIPPVAVRLRRDFGALLALVRTHAILHQSNRGRLPDGRIVATLEDYRVVRDLVADLMAEGVSATVSATVRATVLKAKELLATRPEGAALSVTELARALELDKSAGLRRAQSCIQKGFLTNLETGRGRPARIQLGDPLPEDQLLLPRVEKLQSGEGCRVASETEGEQRERVSSLSEAVLEAAFTGSDEVVY
jgi:hypothetical protein